MGVYFRLWSYVVVNTPFAKDCSTKVASFEKSVKPGLSTVCRLRRRLLEYKFAIATTILFTTDTSLAVPVAAIVWVTRRVMVKGLCGSVGGREGGDGRGVFTVGSPVASVGGGVAAVGAGVMGASVVGASVGGGVAAVGAGVVGTSVGGGVASVGAGVMGAGVEGASVGFGVASVGAGVTGAAEGLGVGEGDGAAVGKAVGGDVGGTEGGGVAITGAGVVGDMEGGPVTDASPGHDNCRVVRQVSNTLAWPSIVSVIGYPAIG